MWLWLSWAACFDHTTGSHKVNALLNISFNSLQSFDFCLSATKRTFYTFSHASSVALTRSSVILPPPLWSSLKYLHECLTKHWMDCLDVWYVAVLRGCDCPDFSCNIIMMLTFVVMTGTSQQELDALTEVWCTHWCPPQDDPVTFHPAPSLEQTNCTASASALLCVGANGIVSIPTC